MNMKGKALLAGCIALVMSSAALAEDIKIAICAPLPLSRRLTSMKTKAF